MTIRLEIVPADGQFLNRSVVYRPPDFSFDTVPSPQDGFASVLVDDLNLEVNKSGRVISIWGVCPHTRWVEATLELPSSEAGGLWVSSGAGLARGVSIRLNDKGYLPTYVDRNSGVVQVKTELAPAAAVTVFPGVIVQVGNRGEFCALWLRPRRGLEGLRGFAPTHGAQERRERLAIN